nr:MAG TPA: hypothetical protein [Bacteriophage sp.]
MKKFFCSFLSYKHIFLIKVKTISNYFIMK